ncbi:MAG: cytidine deaminase [Candidatus Cloacimonetes bacterium]|nr:cytidine deaminase [Candidatus Cloacimonadota bacterium]
MQTLDKQEQELMDAAKAATLMAYAPYSGFKVGAALRCEDGSIVTGCNVENASYSLTLCAERTAIFKAISDGKQDFTAIAVYVDSDKVFPPCGACRQVIYEFSPNIAVIYGNRKDYIKTNIVELLPGAFTLDKA